MSNFKKYKSMMGYRDDSPFRDEPYIDINTPTGVIDMSQTGIPLFANGQLLPPYSGQYNMGTTRVREIPATKGYVNLNPMEGNIMAGLSHAFGNTTLSVNGILPIQSNPYDPFKGIGGIKMDHKIGKNTSIGLGLNKTFLGKDPFTNEQIYSAPFEPKISFTHNFQKGGENDIEELDTVEVVGSKNEQSYYPDYNFYDLTKEKQKLIEKLQSEAFKNRYYKQYENITGNQISDEEYNQRLADQIKFIQEGADQATPIMYERNEDGNIEIWNDEEIEGNVPHKYALMHPTFMKDYLGKSRGHVEYLLERDADGEPILDENGNPTVIGWDMGLLGPKEYEAIEHLIGPDGYSQFSAPDGVHPYAHSTMQHELSHLYNANLSPLWRGVEGYDENADYIKDIFGEDQPWYSDEHTRDPVEIGAGKVMFEQALMDYGIWDPNKGEFGDKHLKKLNKAIEKNQEFISDPRVGNFLFMGVGSEGVNLQRPEVNEYLESIGLANDSSDYLYDYGTGISGVIGPRMMQSDLTDSIDIINRYESRYEEMPSRKEAKSKDYDMSNWRWNKKRNKEEDKLMNKFLSDKGIKNMQDPDYDILYDFSGSFINEYMTGSDLRNLYYKGETSDAEYFTTSDIFNRNHPGFKSAPEEIKEKYEKKYQELLAGDNLNTLINMLGNSSRGWNYRLGNLYDEETEQSIPYTGQPLSDEDIAFYKDFETQFQNLSNQLKTELYEYHKNKVDNKGENVKKYLNEIAMEEDASMDNTVMAKYGSEVEESMDDWPNWMHNFDNWYTHRGPNWARGQKRRRMWRKFKDKIRDLFTRDNFDTVDNLDPDDIPRRNWINMTNKAFEDTGPPTERCTNCLSEPDYEKLNELNNLKKNHFENYIKRNPINKIPGFTKDTLHKNEIPCTNCTEFDEVNWNKYIQENSFEEGGESMPEWFTDAFYNADFRPNYQGMLPTVNVGPGADATEYFQKRLPYYNYLRGDQKQHLNDVYLGKIPRSVMFDAVVMQGREGYGIGDNPTFTDSVYEFAGTFGKMGLKPLQTTFETLTVPQALTVEGIEAIRGEDFNFANVLPSGLTNFEWFSNQRFPSETYLKDAKPGWKIFGDVFADPLMIGGLVRGGPSLLRSGANMVGRTGALGKERQLAAFINKGIDDAASTGKYLDYTIGNYPATKTLYETPLSTPSINLNTVKTIEQRGLDYINKNIIGESKNLANKGLPYWNIDSQSGTIWGQSGKQFGHTFKLTNKEKELVKKEYFRLAKEENLFNLSILDEKQMMIDKHWFFNPKTGKMQSKNSVKYRYADKDKVFFNEHPLVNKDVTFPEFLNIIKNDFKSSNLHIGFNMQAQHEFLKSLQNKGITTLTGKELKTMFPNGFFHGSTSKINNLDELILNPKSTKALTHPDIKTQPGGFFASSDPNYALQYMNWTRDMDKFGKGVNSNFWDINPHTGKPFGLSSNRTMHQLNIADDAVVHIGKLGKNDMELGHKHLKSILGKDVDLVFDFKFRPGFPTNMVNTSELAVLNKKGLTKITPYQPTTTELGKGTLLDDIVNLDPHLNRMLTNPKFQKPDILSPLYNRSGERISPHQLRTDLQNRRTMFIDKTHSPDGAFPWIKKQHMYNYYKQFPGFGDFGNVPLNNLTLDKRYSPLINQFGIEPYRINQTHGWWKQGGELPKAQLLGEVGDFLGDLYDDYVEPAADWINTYHPGYQILKYSPGGLLAGEIIDNLPSEQQLISGINNVADHIGTGLSTVANSPGIQILENSPGGTLAKSMISMFPNPYNYYRTGDKNPIQSFLSGEYKKYPEIEADNFNEAFAKAQKEYKDDAFFIYNNKRYKNDLRGETRHEPTKDLLNRIKNSKTLDQSVKDNFINLWSDLNQPNMQISDEDTEYSFGGLEWVDVADSARDHVNSLSDPGGGSLYIKEKEYTDEQLVDALLNELTHVQQQNQIGRRDYNLQYLKELALVGGDQDLLYNAHFKHGPSLEYLAHNDMLWDLQDIVYGESKDRGKNYASTRIGEKVKEHGHNHKYGGSIPKAEDGKETTVDFNQLEKGIKYVESLNGELMENENSSASGYYGQLFSEIEDIYDGTREDFIADTDYQLELFTKRANGQMEGVPGLLNNGTEVYNEYKDQVNLDDHGLTPLTIAGLSNMLGRQGTREYIGYVLRDGKTLEEVFPDLYGENVEAPNHTPTEYIEKFNKGLLIKKQGGQVGRKIKRLKQQLQLYKDGKEMSSLAERELIALGLIKPRMQTGGSYTVKSGDRLGRIARDNNMTLKELIALNPQFENDPGEIYPGQKVYFNSEERIIDNESGPNLMHVIKKGETLSGIANTYGLDYMQLAKLNDIKDPASIRAGVSIKLPSNVNIDRSNEKIQKQEKIVNSPYNNENTIILNDDGIANQVWVKRELVYDWDPNSPTYGQSTWQNVEGKRNTIKDINQKQNQVDRIVSGINDNYTGTYKENEYIVKPGDNLSTIAKNNNTSISKIMNDNAIEDKNHIEIGQKLKLIKSDSQPYLILDDSKGRLHVYYPGDEDPRYSYPVLTGAMSGDQQTQTVTSFFKDGEKLSTNQINEAIEKYDLSNVDELITLPGYTSEVDWDMGNKITGAGIYEIDLINEDTGYYDETGENKSMPSFTFTNEAGIKVPMVIHGGTYDRRGLMQNIENLSSEQTKVSNGCINGRCSDLNELYNLPGIGTGTQMYVLPEEEGNNFIYENGKINFYSSRDNQRIANAGYTTQDGEYIEGGPGINVTQQHHNYKPINITFNKETYQNKSERYDDSPENEELEFVTNTQPFLNSIADNKKMMMEKLGIDGDLYNDLAMIAFGIYGYESGMGDINTSTENASKFGVKAGSKIVDKLTTGVNDLIGTDIKPIGSQTSPDVQSKYTTYGQRDDGNSVGWTQIRWNDRDESELLALEKIGITDPQQLMDPATSALATIAILYKEYQNQIPSKEKNNSAFDIFTALPKVYSPTGGDNYADMVNQYMDYIELSETDIDDLDNNLIIKGEYTADKRSNVTKLANAVDDVLGVNEGNEQVGNVLDYMLHTSTDEKVDDVKEWWKNVDLNPFWKLGGEFGLRNQNQFYNDYINGVYKNTKQEKNANKLFDKINRMYYNDSKKSGMHQLDVLRKAIGSQSVEQ